MPHNLSTSNGETAAAQTPGKSISFWGWPCIIAFLILVLDQLTKWLIDVNCPIGWSHNIIPGFFNLVHTRNTGGAWGILNQHTWLLALFSFVAFLLLLRFFKAWNAGNTFTATALALLQGGIVGNMIDRAFRKSVIDFLDFFLGNAHWPAFNVADSAICVAIFFLCIESFLSERKKKQTVPQH